MNRNFFQHFSHHLQRNMSMIVYGYTGVPVLVFPCQDSMSDNFENFGMIDVMADYIEQGRIQVFCVDTVDKESWSDVNGNPEHRAYIQEQYYNYIVNEVVPVIHDINTSDRRIITTGCSLGATHAAIAFFRRPDLFEGVLAMSGCYDAPHFWNGWCNETLYNNSPVHFLANMPEDHYYIDLYNQRKIVLVIGQGAWEDEGRRTTAIIRDIFAAKNIHGLCDFWGYDVNHDWPWWKIQMSHFLPLILQDIE